MFDFLVLKKSLHDIFALPSLKALDFSQHQRGGFEDYLEEASKRDAEHEEKEDENEDEEQSFLIPNENLEFLSS